MTCVLPLCLHKAKKTFGGFQVDAQEAYVCKQILGLCHSPPQMEYQVKVEKIISCRKKGSHESNHNRLKSLYESIISVSVY